MKRSFIICEEKKKKGGNDLGTYIPAFTQTSQDTNTPQNGYKVIRSTIKLHTEHNTAEELSQRTAFIQEKF